MARAQATAGLTVDGAQQIGSWRELYLMLGTSSAALIGLLFVAASLHLREIVNDEIYRVRAHYTTLLLVGTLVQAAAILTPQPMFALGVELLAINLWSFLIPLRLLFKAVAMREAGKRGGLSLYRVAYFLSTYAIGVAGSLILFTRTDWGLYGVTVAYIGGLLATIWNAWNIMLGIGQSERNGAIKRKEK